MNIAGVSFMAPFSGSNQQTTVETGDGHAFAQVLSSLRQTSPSLQSLSEQPETMQRMDWEQLQQWFAQLPIHDGYAEKQTLSNEMIQSFLSLLPEETKEQMIQQFSAGQPFETMFSPQDDLDEEDELMLVIALFQLEQKQWTIPEPIIEHARATLRNVFGTNDEQSDTMKDMLQKLIELGDYEKTRRHVGQVETELMQKVIEHQRALLSTVDSEKTTSDMKSVVARLQGQSWQPVQKEVAPLPQQRKQPIARPSEQMAQAHVAQQSNDKHVPFELRTIDTTSETPFVAQFERIIRSSQLTRWKNGNTQLLIRLHPEHLGHVTIKLIEQKGKLTAKMITSTEAAKQLVEQHIHQLAHIADRITVEQFNVFDQAKFRDHSFHQQKQQQQQQEQQKEEKKQPDQSFDEWLNEWFHFDM
ncbi:flagellar hook-length control protein FliK [Anoxybacillus mongoliensis]|uniref:Flagellar hook-length control protein FliK n=1 Tax=Anoxybacillus mongoliensis TaxID=452565 RepID=A0A7W8JD46_9BACL|nr:flagellar hook-length control protein FliK [Anoxybacillus mongoliensis]MBB5354882.1 flagellar hook-length control protein FliK [Anoxybacillus mongoliensis]